MLEKRGRALRGMRLVYIDCGTKDEFNIIWGARTLHAKLRALGVKHVYEEFDEGHLNITYRYDVSLPLLWRPPPVAAGPPQPSFLAPASSSPRPPGRRART